MRYAQAFKACEINSSFYRPHKIETWERWRESVPANFLFSVKAPRTITHESKLSCGTELLEPFLRQIRSLKQNLGPILFQLPPSLEYASNTARRFVSSLRERYAGDVVWEPRHRSWFYQDATDLLTEFHIARVAADPACTALASQPGGWPSPVYFRLHGSPRLYYSAYKDDFLNALAWQIAELNRSTEVWCVFDNTASGYAIPNAALLRDKMAEIAPGTQHNTQG